MKKMVLLATVVGVVALIMAAAPAMASDRDGFGGSPLIIRNGNVGNFGATGLGFNGVCCNNTGFVDGCFNGCGFDGCFDFNFGCHNDVFFNPVVFGFDGCNCFDRDDFFRHHHDRDDFRRNNDLDDFRHNHDMDRR